MSQEIIVVSGLPRSGTSLMMQMLDTGGIDVVTDNVRTPDTDNPKGYYEYEMVKKIKNDTTWLPATRGKAFKMVSQLLYHLPATESYRVIFMERDLDEMLRSQEKMLERLGRAAGPRAEMKQAYVSHLEALSEWLGTQSNMNILRVDFGDLVLQPETQARRVSAFLAGRANVESMVQAVDPTLYRNRKAATA